ncbi:MAG: DUF4282 domain-containing protein [Alphaproteobacteria bacterium]|nr:DUF4282 domain-containing protein [Alphaproteobacteria bacterium]
MGNIFAMFRQWDEFITPKIIKFFYAAWLIIGLIAMIFGIFYRFSESATRVIGYLIFAPIGYLIYAACLRMIAEYLLVQFQIHEELVKIRKVQER